MFIFMLHSPLVTLLGHEQHVKKLINIRFDFNFTKLCFGETDVSSCFIWFFKSRSEPVRWHRRNASVDLKIGFCLTMCVGLFFFIWIKSILKIEIHFNYITNYKIRLSMLINAKTNLIIVTGCMEFSNDLMQHTMLMNS